MIDMLLWCPGCGMRHIDEGIFVTKEHHTHACQGCGMVWRPAIEATRGVRFLPGFGPPSAKEESVIDPNFDKDEIIEMLLSECQLPMRPSEYVMYLKMLIEKIKKGKL